MRLLVTKCSLLVFVLLCWRCCCCWTIDREMEQLLGKIESIDISDSNADDLGETGKQLLMNTKRSNRLKRGGSNKYFYYGSCGNTPRSLMNMYETLGSFDSMYFAVTREEAALFPNLLWDTKKRNAYMYVLKRLGNKIMEYTNGELDKILRLKRYLEKKLGLPHHEVFKKACGNKCDKERNIITEELCHSGNIIDNATDAYILCSSCSTVKELDNKYPRFINEITCQSKSCLDGEGKCKQNTNEVIVLEKTNMCQSNQQQWLLTELLINSGCECQLKKSSKYRQLLGVV